MARKTDVNYGNPKPGEPGLNYDHVVSPKTFGKQAKYDSRRTQPGSPSPGSLNQGSPGKAGGRKPHHYGERAHTKITQVGWPGKAAPSGDSDNVKTRGPHH